MPHNPNSPEAPTNDTELNGAHFNLSIEIKNELITHQRSESTFEHMIRDVIDTFRMTTQPANRTLVRSRIQTSTYHCASYSNN